MNLFGLLGEHDWIQWPAKGQICYGWRHIGHKGCRLCEDAFGLRSLLVLTLLTPVKESEDPNWQKIVWYSLVLSVGLWVFLEVKKTSCSGAVGAQSTNSHYIVRLPNHLFSEDAPVKFMSTSSFETWRQWTEDSEPCRLKRKYRSFIFVYFTYWFWLGFHFLSAFHCHFLINGTLSYTFMSSCIKTLCLSGHNVTSCELHRTFLRAQTIPSTSTLNYVKIHIGWPVHGFRPPVLILAFGAHVFHNTPNSCSCY